MHLNSIDSIYRIIKAINDFEAKQSKKEQQQEHNRLISRLYFEIIIFPFCVALIMGLSGKFLGAPVWVSTTGIAALLISYAGVALHPIIAAIIKRKSFFNSIRDPFSVIVNNAKLSTIADQKYLNYLKRKPVEHLKFIQKSLYAEKFALEKRISLVVGSIEKLGILPGILAGYVTLTKITGNVPGWVFAIAYATPILYIVGALAHFHASKLERIASVIGVIIEDKENMP